MNPSWQKRFKLRVGKTREKVFRIGRSLQEFSKGTRVFRFYQFRIQPLRDFPSVYFIPLSIFIIKALEQLFALPIVISLMRGNEFVSYNTATFLTNFFEGFGIIYAFSLPIIITKAWEHFDNMAGGFAKEAEAVRIFYMDLLMLRGQHPGMGKSLIEYVRDYVRHVIRHYKDEVHNLTSTGIEGANILVKMRQSCDRLVYSNNKGSQPEALVLQLIDRLNDIIRLRGTRIALAQQSGSGTLRIVGLVTSILFVVPLYFVRFGFNYGILDNMIVISVTLLVIYIYLIVEDMDKPFAGWRKINNEPWVQIRQEIVRNERQLQIINRNQNNPPTLDSQAEAAARLRKSPAKVQNIKKRKPR